ncbi:HGxxPAAW family protein [Streptomyces sp. NPDC012510]|uniref:HGxxPAAW family protein n=1 Tax=Streptomyces sp. NPDC012510 TaxID=3364838 RepID=UPI0036F16049
MAGSSHGHTPAAWTGVTIAFIGFCVSGAYMVMAQPLGFWAGMVIVALGGVVGMIMRAMGLGQPKDHHAVYETVARGKTATTTPEPAGAKS